MQNILRKRVTLLFFIVLIIAGCASPQQSGEPLKKFIPQLKKSLKRVESVQPASNLPKVLLQEMVIEEEVSFESGKYNLSKEGERILQGLTEEVITVKEKFIDPYPDNRVTITITVAGYTDRSPFIEETDRSL